MSTTTSWSFKPASIDDYYPYWPDVLANTLRPDPKTVFFAARDEKGTILGLCGITMNRDTATFKSAYVPPEHRGKGVWEYMFHARIAASRAAGAKKVRVTATKMITDSWIKRGAWVIKSYPNGNTMMELPL